MSIVQDLREKHGYAPEWRDDKEFPHTLWKEAFGNLVKKYAECLEESGAGDPDGWAEEEAYEIFCWAWYKYRDGDLVKKEKI